MRHFFKNNRKRKYKDVKEVVERKKKVVEKKTITKNIWGVPNFLPPPAEGEDDRTIELHRERLVEQYRKNVLKRNINSINVSMSKSFPARRKLIVQDITPIMDLLEMYPILHDFEQVRLSFQVGYQALSELRSSRSRALSHADVELNCYCL